MNYLMANCTSQISGGSIKPAPSSAIIDQNLAFLRAIIQWCFVLFFLLFPSFQTLYAQTDVTATIRILPPYPVRLSEYADNPERTLITLRNNTQRTLRLQ